MTCRAPTIPVLPDWWWTIDRVALAGMLALMAIGLVLAFAASPAATGRRAMTAGNFSYALKQFAFAATAVGDSVGASMLDFRQQTRIAGGRCLRAWR